MKRNCYRYKKIWIEHNGEIPKDENGMSYEIHHINNISTDDRIENLACISIQEHFDIHYKHGDYKACQLIAGRMNNPSLGKKMSEEFKKKQSMIQKKKVEDGTHHLLSGAIQRLSNKKRVENCTHNFQSEEAKMRITIQNAKNIENGTHSLLKKDDGSSVGAINCRQRIASGTHHFLDSKKQSELSQRAKLVNQKPVIKMTLSGEYIEEYESVQHILLLNPDYKSTIYRKIGIQKEYMGYLWKYK